ncbi:MAG: hypothetical protein Tsb005_19660 [Gammaproteobacteria bacterium]
MPKRKVKSNKQHSKIKTQNELTVTTELAIENGKQEEVVGEQQPAVKIEPVKLLTLDEIEQAINDVASGLQVLHQKRKNITSVERNDKTLQTGLIALMEDIQNITNNLDTINFPKDSKKRSAENFKLWGEGKKKLQMQLEQLAMKTVECCYHYNIPTQGVILAEFYFGKIKSGMFKEDVTSYILCIYAIRCYYEVREFSKLAEYAKKIIDSYNNFKKHIPNADEMLTEAKFLGVFAEIKLNKKLEPKNKELLNRLLESKYPFPKYIELATEILRVHELSDLIADKREDKFIEEFKNHPTYEKSIFSKFIESVHTTVSPDYNSIFNRPSK